MQPDSAWFSGGKRTRAGIFALAAFNINNIRHVCVCVYYNQYCDAAATVAAAAATSAAATSTATAQMQLVFELNIALPLATTTAIVKALCSADRILSIACSSATMFMHLQNVCSFGTRACSLGL